MCRVDIDEHELHHISEWEKLKAKGSEHYKTGEVEPIDLYKSAGILEDFSIGNIIKYAYRLKKKGLNGSDIDKIIHYAEMLKALWGERVVTVSGLPDTDYYGETSRNYLREQQTKEK